MKKFNEPLFVVLYDIFIVVVVGVLIYITREWWVLFIGLLSASYKKDEQVKENDIKTQ